MASEQTKLIIDAAVQGHINEVFARLASTTEPNAVQRFVSSWNQTIKFRDSVMVELNK